MFTWTFIITFFHVCRNIVVTGLKLTSIALKNKFLIDQVYSNTRVSTQVNTSQHELTRINTNQRKSNTSQRESTQMNTSLTRVNTSPKQVLDKNLLKI